MAAQDLQALSTGSIPVAASILGEVQSRHRRPDSPVTVSGASPVAVRTDHGPLLDLGEDAGPVPVRQRLSHIECLVAKMVELGDRIGLATVGAWMRLEVLEQPLGPRAVDGACCPRRSLRNAPCSPWCSCLSGPARSACCPAALLLSPPVEALGRLGLPVGRTESSDVGSCTQ